MYGLKESTWTAWKAKRRNTLIGFIVIGIAVGIDCSVVFSTLFLYLRDLVKAKNPEMWFGLIISFFFMSSTVFGILLGRWVDQTRRIRLYVNIALVVQIVGFLLYTVPFHPLILLFGRIICGVSDSFASVVSGELIRIYDHTERTRAMLWLSSVYTFGFVIGPALNFLFTDVHFFIGPIEVNYSNFIGLFMAALLLVDVIIVNFLVHDCSAEFDLKAHLAANPGYNVDDDPNDLTHGPEPITGNSMVVSEKTEDGGLVAYLPDGPEPPESNLKAYTSKETKSMLSPSSHSTIPVSVVVTALLTNPNTLLVFVSTMGFMSALFAASALTPLLITVTLNMGVKEVSIVYAGEGIIKMGYILLMGKFCRTNRSIYITTLICIASQIFNCALLVLLKMMGRNYTRDAFLLALFAISITFGYSFDDVLIRVMFANMVPSKIQSFGETLRASMSRAAIVLGSLTVTVLLPYVHWWAAGVIVMHLLFTAVFVYRKRHLVDPVEISFNEGYMPIP